MNEGDLFVTKVLFQELASNGALLIVTTTNAEDVVSTLFGEFLGWLKQERS